MRHCRKDSENIYHLTVGRLQVYQSAHAICCSENNSSHLPLHRLPKLLELQTWIFPKLHEDEPDDFIWQKDGVPLQCRRACQPQTHAEGTKSQIVVAFCPVTTWHLIIIIIIIIIIVACRPVARLLYPLFISRTLPSKASRCHEITLSRRIMV
jgi:hypothetical protein